MGKNTCSMPDCVGEIRARGWCAKHYQRWRTTGTPEYDAPIIKTLEERIADGGKSCGTCGEFRALDEYYKRKDAADGLQIECKPCRNKAVRQWKLDNPERARRHQKGRSRDRAKEMESARAQRATDEGKRRMRGYRLRATHGISLDEYEQLLANQDGVCAICRQPPPGGNHVDAFLNVDHCHASGVIRGLLCRYCNTAIGLLRDDPERLEAAAMYIRQGFWVPA